MQVKLDFETEEERNNIVAQMKADGYRLIEEQHYYDGKHLIFEKPDRDLATEIDDLKVRVEKLEK